MESWRRIYKTPDIVRYSLNWAQETKTGPNVLNFHHHHHINHHQYDVVDDDDNGRGDETGRAVMNMEMTDGSHLMARFPAHDDIIVGIILIIVVIIVIVVIIIIVIICIITLSSSCANPGLLV